MCGLAPGLWIKYLGSIGACESPTEAPNTAADPLWIGAVNYPGGGAQDELFDGQIDDVRVWRVIRTGDQIRSAMDAGLSGQEQEAVGTAFRELLMNAIEHGGNYYLTYHRWATREQVLTCYPQFPEFLRLKRKHDSTETFQSDWYRHYSAMFKDTL